MAISDLFLGKPARLEFDPDTGGYRLAVSIGTGSIVQAITPYMTDSSLTNAGMVTGTVSGSYVQGPNVTAVGGFYLRGHPDNTKSIYVGSTGVFNRYPLGNSDQMILMVPNLNLLWFSVDANGEKVCWIKA